MKNNDEQKCTKDLFFGRMRAKVPDICRKLLEAAARRIINELRKKGFLIGEGIGLLQDFGLNVDSIPQDERDVKGYDHVLRNSIVKHLYSCLWEWRVDNATLNVFWCMNKYVGKLLDFARQKEKSSYRYYWKRFTDVLRLEDKRPGSGCTLQYHKQDNPCREPENFTTFSGAHTFSFEGNGLPVFTPAHLRQHEKQLTAVPLKFSMRDLEKGEEGEVSGEDIIALCRHFSDGVRDCLGAPYAICLSACLTFLQEIYPTTFRDPKFTSLDVSIGDEEDGAALHDKLLFDKLPPYYAAANYKQSFSQAQISAICMEVRSLIEGWTDEECEIFYESFMKGSADTDIAKLIHRKSSSGIKIIKERLLKDIKKAVDEHPLSADEESEFALFKEFVFTAAKVCKTRI